MEAIEHRSDSQRGLTSTLHIPLEESKHKVPLPATLAWPEGVWDVEAFAHGTMSVVYFAPRGIDHQVSHEQDELYVVIGGSGVLVVEGRRTSFRTGDVLFVPAKATHRFEDFSDDFATWAVFWGPAGGER